MTVAIVTAATCGENCWIAAEDTCRCSCGGRNHGVLRSGNGQRPERTARIQGQMYRLVAVGTSGEIWTEMMARKEACWNEVYPAGHRYAGLFDHGHNDRGARFWQRKASDSAVNSWPELTAARSFSPAAHWYEVPNHTLWERVD